MSFSSIPSSIIAAGKSATTTLFSLIKSNQDDLNTRLTLVEAGANKIIVFDNLVINAATLASGGTATGIALWRAPSNFTLTDARVYIFTKGSLTGNLEIDFKKSSTPDFTSSVSVFTTKPKVVYSTASDYEVSSNAVFDATNANISQNNFIRFDVTELPSGGSIGKFGIVLYGEAS